MSACSKRSTAVCVEWPLRPSLFPKVPPYLTFKAYDCTEPTILPCGRNLLKWRYCHKPPDLVWKTLTNSGFTMVQYDSQAVCNKWIGSWGRTQPPPIKTIRYMQKTGYFPGTQFTMGRKDSLWDNFQKLIELYGRQDDFDFLPETYILPRDLTKLRWTWKEINGKSVRPWIIKPLGAARGEGVKVINKWSQLPEQPIIVQKYISNPYLINDSKFDLRLYVLVTSFDPLRIYLYGDGLARFACVKYSDDPKDIGNRCRHLTNYSVNKLSDQYRENVDANACQGHKWTIKKLFEYLEGQGIVTENLWQQIKDIVIKTMIAGEPRIVKNCKELKSRYNCYELFGIDILLDDHLNIWLLEVNTAPSFLNNSPVDAHVKGPLLKTLLDVAQYHLPPKFKRIRGSKSPLCLDPKWYSCNLTIKEQEKQAFFNQYKYRCEYLFEILENLTGDDIRHLIQAEDEFTVKGQFERIFPTKKTYRYFDFMETRYYNRLFDAWENKYENNRGAGIIVLRGYCKEGIHLPSSVCTGN